MLKIKKCYDIIISKNIENIENKDYYNYLKCLSSYKFAICPEGNGIDTHRFHECLYLKTIPICLHNHVTYYYSKIYPVVLLDKWDDLDVLVLKTEEAVVINKVSIGLLANEGSVL